MIYLTRKESFNAAHKLFKPEWSDEKNFEVFGKCSNPNWHGHNYSLFVTVKGKPDPVTGYLIDLKKLSAIVRDTVIEKMDHKNLNLEVDFLKDIMPSTENIAIAIFNQLNEKVKELGGTLHSIKVYETENNFAEYFGD